MQTVSPPTHVEQLEHRVKMISGMTLASLATSLGINIPMDLSREKGWVGQLLEQVLGASAGNKPEPDFIHLGIELKTLPIDSKGNPTESTYVCVVPLKHTEGLFWDNSLVKAKLNRVLWMPIEADKQIPLAQRRVGMGIFWQPSTSVELKLATDYNEFLEKISLGQVETITAHQGEVLQIRPKAANAAVLTQGIGDEGQSIRTLPRGFYLRPTFTRQILSQWREQP